MHTLTALEIAHTEQDARVRHAIHVRALKAYRRDHGGAGRGRQRIASALRRWATRLDGRTVTATSSALGPTAGSLRTR